MVGINTRIVGYIIWHGGMYETIYKRKLWT